MRFPDADENLRRARSMIESVRAVDRGARVEIYHRASVRRRAGIAAPRGAPEIQEAMEEGIAVRVRIDARVGFAATAGAEPELVWALDRALANATPASASHALWADGGGPPLLDREELRLPQVEELLAWLSGMGGCWVETGGIVETLATNEGLLASRARTRAWAMALRPSTPGGREQPRTIYGRDLPELDPSDWRDESIETPPITRGRAPDPAHPVVFEGESVRALVLALASALHGEHSTLGLPVAKGWRLRDDPGGSFDDAGFRSEPVLLADGHATLRAIEGPGHLRRASYRDWPEAHPACLTIFGENAPFPHEATHILDVRIHAPDPGSWIVEGDGYVVRGGFRRGWFRGALARTGPGEIVRQVVATSGPALSYGTVVAPALVVEGLRFEA